MLSSNQPRNGITARMNLSQILCIGVAAVAGDG